MPAYGHQISHYDRWHIVNYVRQMQGVGPGSGEAGSGEADGGGGESGDVEAAPPEGGVN